LGKHLIAVFFGLFIINLSTHAEDVILRHSFAGNISFELTGNTLRDSNNTCNAIAGGQSSGSISLPPNASVKAAYLYWSGSGGIDTQINFNGQPVNSQNNYTEVFDSRNYYSAKADVTNLVSNNTVASYQVSGLTFDGSNSYCATAGAYGGWALAIVFEHADEPLRVINVFDGFKNFWGSEFTLIPNNFVIAANPSSKGGKHAHITWEGDEGNSQARGGFTESLKFEGFDLTDFPLNPADNQFNGYSNVTGTTSGVDIDAYEIGNYLNAGDTSVYTKYSSGQDAVFLTAEIISVPNEPVADLSIQQSGPANIIRGEENTFNFNVTNNGPNTAPQNSQFSFTIPQGFSYVNQTGNNWNCSTNNDDLSCIYNNQILNSNNSSPLSLTFIVDKTAGANDSINLTGSISGLLFDNILSNNSDQKSYLLKATDLTTSIKSVIDLNGGNVSPGDTLRYTISINENAGYGANDVSLTDHIDAVFSNYQVVSLPLNATDNSLAAPNGNSNAGVVKIDDIFISANGSEDIVIDATLSASIASGSTIDNSALLSSIAFDDVTITAQTLYTAQPIQPASGNKLLYLNSVRTVNRTSQIMRRNRPTSQDYRNIGRDNKDGIWTLNPEFQSTFEFSSNTIDFNLCLQSNQNNNIQHDAQVQLLHNTTVIADSGPQSITLPNKNETPIQWVFSLTLSQTSIIAAGDTLKFRLVNITGEGGIRVYSKVGSDFCYVSVPAKTVINVDSITVINSSNNTVNEISAGSTVSIRSAVSDPFGSFDITSADLTATDPDGNTIFSAQTMSVFNDSVAATKTFNFDYSIPSTAKEGYWKFSVRAKEGEENTIDHRSDFMLLVKQPEPNINVVKSVDVFSDPIHGESTTNNYAKALPGSILTYTISAENTGSGVTVNDTIIITDGFPDKTHMLVKDFNDISGQGPVFEVSSTPSSGITYTYIALDSDQDDLEFSNNSGVSFTYSPIPDSDGIDKNITHFRINPKGVFQAPAAGESPTQFTIKFRVRLQ
jgi:uncharacterized repeat protein (TIGR01451 family)